MKLASVMLPIAVRTIQVRRCINPPIAHGRCQGRLLGESSGLVEAVLKRREERTAVLQLFPGIIACHA